jgi:two-component system chemotaxis response regulator CheY
MIGRPVQASSKILVVDDEPAIRDSVAECLESEGYPVQALARAADVLEWLQREPAALVLVDLVMPGMNGAELVERLRADANPAVRAVPVVLMTAAIPTASERAVPADGILRKPFEVDDLLAAVARHCPPNR